MCTLPPSPMAPCLPAAVAASSTACRVPHGCGAIELPRTPFFAPTRRRAHLLPKTTSFSTTEGAPGQGSGRPWDPTQSSALATARLLPIRGATAAAKTPTDNDEDAGAADPGQNLARRESTVGASCGPRHTAAFPVRRRRRLADIPWATVAPWRPR